MKRPSDPNHKPGFLFVHQSGANDSRGKAERRRISSHVMRHYAARARDGHNNRDDHRQEPIPRIMRFHLPISDCEQPELQLPQVVAANSFDPFDSLAAQKQKNTVLILRSLFEPVQHNTKLFSWTDRYFEALSGHYCDAAMGDATTYHVVGTMQLAARQNKDF